MGKMRKRLEWERSYGRTLNRLRFKSSWKRYMDGIASYAVYKEIVFILVNNVRKMEDLPPYSFEKFDNGWQYRNVCHENYKVAYNEMLNLIYGWW